MERSTILKITLFILTVTFFSLIEVNAEAADKENCLMCHKYRQIGRIDEQGRKRSYYVNENIYSNTVHRNVPCRDCHTYINKLPHDPVTEEVNCANECHIKPPFSSENFSHKKIIDVYNKSVHGLKPNDSTELKKAKPYCKYCHQNPIYTKVDEERVASTSLLRCLNCHERQGVTMAYKHITHRLRNKTSRSPQEIVQLCSKNCHENVEQMKRFRVSEVSLEAVETYNSSIHGKSVSLGSQVSADCVSCHATNSIHDIYKKDESQSTVNLRNKANTCRQCHTNVNDRFVQIDVHSSHKKPIIHFIAFGLTFAFYGSVFGLIGLSIVETLGRKKDGIEWQIKKGTSWRGVVRRKPKV
ncbi:MAG: hypothetical protein HY808_13405 [Nitrospirae bacterium]|nr:hypothetical protein [Nitrospirota bacterium]